jgi:hypothetical protein
VNLMVLWIIVNEQCVRSLDLNIPFFQAATK